MSFNGLKARPPMMVLGSTVCTGSKNDAGENPHFTLSRVCPCIATHEAVGLSPLLAIMVDTAHNTYHTDPKEEIELRGVLISDMHIVSVDEHGDEIKLTPPKPTAMGTPIPDPAPPAVMPSRIHLAKPVLHRRWLIPPTTRRPTLHFATCVYPASSLPRSTSTSMLIRHRSHTAR